MTIVALPRVEVAPRRARFRFRISPTGLVGLVLVVLAVALALLAPLLAPFDPTLQDLRVALQPPGGRYLLGTDEFGRDLFSRMLYGARTSLLIGLLAATLGLALGLPIGLVTGYYGKYVDAIGMRAIDVLLAFPGILLALTVVSVLGPGTENIIIAVAIFSIPAFARLARSSTLELRRRDYVTAAQLLGAGDARILIRHIVPNVFAPLATLWTLRIGTAILTASGLSFLGLGVQPPTPEWGQMLSNGRSYLPLAPRLAVLPGIAISLVVLGFALLGDWLRDVYDPRLREA